MYVFENPVLQRELLVNLRTKRSFALLLAYQAILGVVSAAEVAVIINTTATKSDILSNM